MTAPAAAQRTGLWDRHQHLVWIVLAALCAVSPLMVRGTSCGHDLSFHLLNWMEVASQWRHGVLRPFWCWPAAWNAGEPRFVFYPPLSWTLGALLGLIVPWAATPILYTLTTLTLCGVTMHRLLREYVSHSAALVGACVYLANPYTLFTAFERTAYAELLAAAWMPLLVLAALQVRVRVPRLALPVALLWLTNAPAAVVGSYTLLLIGLLRCGLAWRHENLRECLRLALRMTTGYLVGFALAAFYVVPAIVQRRYVQIAQAVLVGLRPEDSFLFQHTGDAAHDYVLHQASLLGVVLLGVALVCSALLLLRRGERVAYTSMRGRGLAVDHRAATLRHALPAVLLAVAVVLAWLLTRWSAVVWRHAPELAFLQFPWRFLTMGAVLAVIAMAMLLPAQMRPRSTIALALLAGLAGGWMAHSLYAQVCDDEDAPAAQVALFHNGSGAEPTDEYTPSDADNDALKNKLPAAWIALNEDDGPRDESVSRVVTVESGKSGKREFVVRPGAYGGFLVVRLRQFYGWHATVDGVLRPIDPKRDDGLIALSIAAGSSHNVVLQYRWTWDEWLGSVASLITLSGFLLTGRKPTSGTEAPQPA